MPAPYCSTVSCWQQAPCALHGKASWVPRRASCGSRVRVAAIQVPSVFADVATNTERIGALCEEAAQKGAKIIVLPETCITGYLGQDQKSNWCRKGKLLDPPFTCAKDPDLYGESCPGPSTKYFGALAKKHRVYITVPLVEKAEIEHWSEPQHYYNTVALVNPEGNVVAHYRKNYTWEGPEATWASKGTALASFDTEYGRVGLAICYDIHQILDRYVDEGVWTLLYSIGWVGSGQFWYREELPRRLKAVHLPYYIVGANWSTDVPQDWEGAGWSTIYGPDGAVLAGTDETTGSTIVYADLPTAESTVRYDFDRQLYKEHWNDMFSKHNPDRPNTA